MRTLLFILLSLFSILSATQARSDRELIWMPDSNLLLRSRIAFEQVRVIDARDTKSHIGWLRTGALNRYGKLVTKDSLHLVLSRYATKLAKAARHQQGELVVVLRSFWLEDKKANEEIGTVHLRADLFRSNGGPTYRHVRSLDTFYETKSGWDVTASVRQLGTAAIADMLYVGSESNLSAASYLLHQVAGRQSEALDKWPVFTTANPPVGLYRTLDDFLNLQPTAQELTMKAGEPMRNEPAFIFYYTDAKGRRGKEISANECFAIYDGRMWYLAHRQGFNKMPQQGREFFAMQPLKGLTDESLAAGMAGGLLGTLIANADHGKHYTWYVTRFDAEYRRFVPVKRAR